MPFAAIVSYLGTGKSLSFVIAMNIDSLDLARHFSDMSDDELLHRCGAGSLTEVAQPIAEAELSSRGLRLTSASESTLEENVLNNGDFETVAHFFSPTDAYVMAACLEAAGIQTYVADANLVQANSLWAVALGGVRVRVPSACVAEALDIIDAFNRGDLALPDEDKSYLE
jgi:hypothetical protein